MFVVRSSNHLMSSNISQFLDCMFQNFKSQREVQVQSGSKEKTLMEAKCVISREAV